MISKVRLAEGQFTGSTKLLDLVPVADLWRMDKKIWKDGKVTAWTKQLHDDVTKTSQLQDRSRPEDGHC